MKLKDYSVAFSATLVVMISFLSIIFLADVNPAYAASAKKKMSAVVKVSAVDHAEAQIKELQAALKLAGSQEILWDNLTQVMRENAKEMDAFIKDKAENKKPINAVERMKSHSQTTEAHLNQMNKLIPPFEALYVSMSEEQKNITDTIFRTGKRGKQTMK
jgi:hypothetical protein